MMGASTPRHGRDELLSVLELLASPKKLKDATTQYKVAVQELDAKIAEHQTVLTIATTIEAAEREATAIRDTAQHQADKISKEASIYAAQVHAREIAVGRREGAHAQAVEQYTKAQAGAAKALDDRERTVMRREREATTREDAIAKREQALTSAEEKMKERAAKLQQAMEA
jgi:hypothetical protein